jgi:trehalose-6-phosphate synthase
MGMVRHRRAPGVEEGGEADVGAEVLGIPGVLILSRFAGAGRECEAHYDPDSVAVAIGQALSMPLTERRERYMAIFRVLSDNDIQYWADRFLSTLQREPTTLNRLEQMPPVVTQ